MSDRLPPHSLESERAVLGAILMDSDLIHSVKGLLCETDFYLMPNRVVFSAMLALSESNYQIDCVSVGEWLQRHKKAEQVGGASGVGELLEGVATTVHTVSHAKQVKALSAQRGLLTAAQSIVAQSYQPQDNINEFLGQSMTAVIQAASANTGNDPTHVSHDILRIGDTAMSGAKTIMREPSGVIELDNMIHGLPKKKLVVVAGRPGMGKSTLALNMARNVARSGPVLFFTLEDDIQSQQARLISMESGVPYFDLDGGGVRQELHGAITLATANTRQLKIWFEERRLTVDEICQKTIAFRGVHGKIKLCVVDHVGYIASGSGNRERSAYDTVSDNIRQLAFLAKEIKAPVIALVQLNRKIEARGNKADGSVDFNQKKPTLGDLRDSGKIEEDARMVIMVFRKSMYDKTASEHDMDIIVSKNTQGPTGTIPVNCDIKCCRVGGGREY